MSLSGEESSPSTPLTLAGIIIIDLNAMGTVINRTHPHVLLRHMIEALSAVHRRDKQEALWYVRNLIRRGKFESV